MTNSPYFSITLALKASQMSQEELDVCEDYLYSGDQDKLSLAQCRDTLVSTEKDNHNLFLANSYLEETVHKLLLEVETLKAKLLVYKTKNRGLEESLTYRTNLLFK